MEQSGVTWITNKHKSGMRIKSQFSVNFLGSGSMKHVVPPVGILRRHVPLIPRSAVFSDFAAPCKIFLAAPGADPKFLVSDTGQIFFFNFLTQSCAFWSSLTLTRD